MDCLFKTKTTITYKEYKKFNHSIVFSKKIIILHIVMSILLIFCGIAFKAPFYILFLPLYFLILILLVNSDVKRSFSTNKILQNSDVNYDFYDTYFIATEASGLSTLNYEKLYKIIETKTNFYLMLAKNQGFILLKSEFPQGLTEFLQNIKQSHKL